MAKSDNQKLKLFYLLKILQENSDESHPISTKDLILKLSYVDIKAERKTIYSDIECLKDFGYDVIYNSNKKNGGYYLGSRDFELAEIKLMIDMIQSSRFLSLKKSRELIKKLEGLTSLNDSRELQRNVYVVGRVKAENESVYYNVDLINSAINSNKSISFQYYEYSIDKELKLRKDGEFYVVSAYYLTWNNENYYLIGVDKEYNQIRHYRVDRMKKISINDEERFGSDLFKKFDIAEYTNGVFGMFGGEKVKTKIEFTNDLINVVIDRFGKGISVVKSDDQHFTVVLDVVPSMQFYGWLCGLGVKAKIISPENIKEAYHDHIGNIYRLS